MQVILPEEALPVRLNPELRLDDEAFFALCVANPDVIFERSAKGEIYIVPPAGFESDHRNLDLAAQLMNWAKRDRRGRVTGPNGEFILPTGAAYVPDAAWVSNEQLNRLTKDQKRKFPPVCPEFIVELMSPSDRLPAAKKKMLEWQRAGVELAWLIQPDQRTVYIYRAGQDEPEMRTEIDKLAGEGPIAGFELDLTEIWAGV
jgi:Uma2 family endonuclease